MAKSANQKLKLLILKDYLLRNSDEKHPVTIPQIIEELGRYDIKAERKSLYDDLEALRVYGLDIVQSRGNYYVGQRNFETPELKLLVDSIQSSKFITEKKTMSLIKKLEELASMYDAQLLERQVYVRNRVKSMNESVYYNVDSIADAINQDRAIRFKYFEYTVTKEHRIRRNGDWYVVSPFALMLPSSSSISSATVAAFERLVPAYAVRYPVSAYEVGYVYIEYASPLCSLILWNSLELMQPPSALFSTSSANRLASFAPKPGMPMHICPCSASLSAKPTLLPGPSLDAILSSPAPELSAANEPESMSVSFALSKLPAQDITMSPPR